MKTPVILWLMSLISLLTGSKPLAGGYSNYAATGVKWQLISRHTCYYAPYARVGWQQMITGRLSARIAGTTETVIREFASMITYGGMHK